MRVLLLHSEDVPWRGPWANARWDCVIDLAFAGPDTYAEWTTCCGSPVRSIHELAEDVESYAWIRGALDPGRNQLVDRMGLDWWEILAVLTYHELRALYLLQRLCGEMGGKVEYYATRAGIVTELLAAMVGSTISTYYSRGSRVQSFARMVKAARKLRPSQIAEVAFDKWDSSYSLRRHLAKARRAKLNEPVVMLPSAYSNVTRILLGYAADLPERKFLLATTRRGGAANNLPPNVTATSLAAYVLAPQSSQDEVHELVEKWSWFEGNTVAQSDALRLASKAGVWRSFPEQLARGIRIRNAWHELMTREPVAGVLCADDLNWYTRIPLLLARRKGLNAVYCCHGALDGGVLFKRSCADRYLAKGEMEKDYLLRYSEVDRDRVEIGAPSSYARGSGTRPQAGTGSIVFFSQPYEVLAGRTVEIYREVLPSLCAVARRSGRKLILKLHPFESVKDRKRVLTGMLSPADLSLVQVVAQVSLEEVLRNAWCGVTVDSSVAVECAMSGVPYFLCSWLDWSGFAYSQQLARYGAGRALCAKKDLETIPELIATWNEPASDRLWKAIEPELLDEILFNRTKATLRMHAS
jgi:hypothetical protein